MNTLQFVSRKFHINLSGKLPLEVPKIGRNELAKLFKDLGFTKGAEVGTWDGSFTKVLCEANPELKLIGVDLDSKTPKKAVPNNCKLVNMKSLQAADRFVDGSLDFVYLDGNHELADATQDIHAWVKKVRSGGIIAGHDFIRYRARANQHSYEAILSYANAYRITPWFVIGRQTDPVRSWFFVKA